MSGRVAICAVAQTRYEPDKWQERFQGMALEVVEKVLAATGATYDEGRGISTVVTNSDDVWDARTISDNAMTDVVGAHFRAEEKVAMDGCNAVGYAAACILSGHDEVVLVVGHCKESQPESRQMVTNLAYDPFYLRPLGFDFLSAAALQARAYMARSGVTEDHLAEIVVAMRSNAARNPLAHARDPVTADEVHRSPLLCDPIRELHRYPVSDGAVAMLLCREERAAELTRKPVFVAGFGNCMDSYFPGDRDLSESAALARARDRAFRMAGIAKPAGAFDVVEIKDCYAHELPMTLDGLGLCPAGAARFIDGGGLRSGRINPSGGMLGGNPGHIGGLARAAEAVLQLRGEAGERQVEGARRALAHGSTGGAGQHQAVLVLER